MITFEPIGPLTLETFTDHADNGGHGGPAEPGRSAEKGVRNGSNFRNESGIWEERKDLAEQRIRVRGGAEVNEIGSHKHSNLADQGFWRISNVEAILGASVI